MRASTLSDEQRRRALSLIFTVGICVLAGSALVNPKLPDFRVYWYGINRFLHENEPLYGMRGGLGYPMLFRYPPVFVALFFPFLLLPFRAAGAVWTLCEAGTLLFLARWSARFLDLDFQPKETVIAILVALPYIWLSFKDGNAQWVVTALTFSSLLLASRKPVAAGSLLSFAIVVKIWPILFSPILLARRQWKAVGALLASSAALWAMPFFMFGSAQYHVLMREWLQQEFDNHRGARDIWYPSQSLRGLLLRFFTDPQVTQPYRQNFPDVHVLRLEPSTIVFIASAISAAAFLLALWAVARSHQSTSYIWIALYFVVFSGFQPFTDRASLISLTPALLVACGWPVLSDYKSSSLLKTLWGVLLALALIEIGSSLSRDAVRWFTALGLHFAILLTLALILWLMTKRYVAARQLSSVNPA